MTSFVVLTKANTELGNSEIALPKVAITEVTYKDKETSWIKYWDGTKIRSAVLIGTVESIARQCNK